MIVDYATASLVVSQSHSVVALNQPSTILNQQPISIH